MPDTHEIQILSSLVVHCLGRASCYADNGNLNDTTMTAIKIAADQIAQQQRERVEKLRKAANISFLGPAYNKQGKTLKEHVIVRLEDMQDLGTALKDWRPKDV